MQGGDYRRALDILRALPPRAAQSKDARFLRGFAAVNLFLQNKNKKPRELLNEAAAAFRSVLAENPKLIRVRLELARALFLRGDDEAAENHFRRVLSGEVSQTMAENIRAFLERIRARRKWRGFFAFALAPDSNINSATGAETIRIGRLPFLLSEDSRARSGVGLVFRGGGDYEIPLDKRRRFFVGGEIYRREHRGRAFDDMILSAHAGMKYKLSANSEIRFAPLMSRRRAGGKRHSRDIGATVGGRADIGRHLSLSPQFSFRARRHRKNKKEDGGIPAFSVAAVWLPSPETRAEMLFGASRRLAKGESARNRARYAGGGFDVFLPGGWTAGMFANWRQTRHQTGNILTAFAPRRDIVRALGLRFSRRGWTVGGFSPRLSLVRERGNSNSPVNDYRANRAELNFLREF